MQRAEWALTAADENIQMEIGGGGAYSRVGTYFMEDLINSLWYICSLGKGLHSIETCCTWKIWITSICMKNTPIKSHSKRHYKKKQINKPKKIDY